MSDLTDRLDRFERAWTEGYGVESDVFSLIAALRGVLDYLDAIEAPGSRAISTRQKATASLVARHLRKRIASTLAVTS